MTKGKNDPAHLQWERQKDAGIEDVRKARICVGSTFKALFILIKNVGPACKQVFGIRDRRFPPGLN